MFARKLSMYLKNDGVLAFKERIEADIIPLLRKQEGFLDEITFLCLNGRQVQAFSLWKTAEHAETYHRRAFPDVAKMLASVIESIPGVQTYEVLNSTVHPDVAAVSMYPPWRPGLLLNQTDLY
jgi:hypothetical protein